MVDIVKSHTLMLVDLAKLKWGGEGRQNIGNEKKMCSNKIVF